MSEEVASPCLTPSPRLTNEVSSGPKRAIGDGEPHTNRKYCRRVGSAEERHSSMKRRGSEPYAFEMSNFMTAQSSDVSVKWRTL